MARASPIVEVENAANLNLAIAAQSVLTTAAL